MKPPDRKAIRPWARTGQRRAALSTTARHTDMIRPPDLNDADREALLLIYARFHDFAEVVATVK